jgi:hypothetical protein
MKRLIKTNQRKKQLNRQHHKMTARRQSYFNQASTEPDVQQSIWQVSQ